MDHKIECKVSDFLTDPSCSALNLFFFVITMCLIFVALIILAYFYTQHYITYWRVPERFRRPRAPVQPPVIPDDTCIDDGPPIRDRHQVAPDDESSPAPFRPFRRIRSWGDLLKSISKKKQRGRSRTRRVRGSESAREAAVDQVSHVETSIDTDTETSVEDASRKSSASTVVPKVEGQNVETIIRSVIDRAPPVTNRTAFNIGPVSQSTIASRRRVSPPNTARLFSIDMDN